MKLYQVDSFTSDVFYGNPAAVCPLEHWLENDVMQRIAMENNLSETAFFVKQVDGSYHIRWFTPSHEVDICGHATLASAHVLFEHLAHDTPTVRFDSRSGPLHVTRLTDGLQMNFPLQDPQPVAIPDFLLEGLGKPPEKLLYHQDLIAVYGSQADIIGIQPDFRTLSKIDTRGICVTAPGDNCDFVSRFFAPRFGIDEDPVTGSAHCQLVPYWAKQLGKTSFLARQLSRRGGTIWCELHNDRVLISGQARTYMIGEIFTD